MNIRNLLNFSYDVDLESLSQRSEELKEKQKNLILYPFQAEVTIKHLDYWGVNSLKINGQEVLKDHSGFFKLKNLSKWKKYNLEMDLDFNMNALPFEELVNILGYKISEIAQEALKDKNLNVNVETQDLLKKFALRHNSDIFQQEFIKDVPKFLEIFKKIDDSYEMFYTPFEKILVGEVQKSLHKIEQSRDFIDFINLHFAYMSIVNLYRREYLLLGLTV